MHENTWQQALAEAITDFNRLCKYLELDPNAFQDILAAIDQFPLRVPKSFVARMEKGNPNDPLLRQVLPLGVETQTVPGFSKDPVGEMQVSPAPGLLHKYPGRVLFTLTGACAVNCRYCFRRHYPYEEKVPGLSQWQAALDYIAANPSIHEVILSGGDPLLVKDAVLTDFISRIENIKNITRLRIHTRFPIVIPERITDALVDLLLQSRLQVVLVFHSNHANELDTAVAKAIQKCSGLHLLNQSVLLKGVNDSVEALVQLSERLFAIGVAPYYLHLLDPVSGAAHFNVDRETGSALIKAMSEQLSGYLVPRLVQEVPGLASKQWV